MLDDLGRDDPLIDILMLESKGEKMKRFLGIAALVVTLALTGCAGESVAEDEQSAVEGSLELVEPQSGEVNYVPVGKTLIPAPGVAVFDRPDGVTVGRLPEGIYEVYDLQDEYFQIVYFDGEVNDLGWIPNDTGLTLGSNTDQVITFDKM